MMEIEILSHQLEFIFTLAFLFFIVFCFCFSIYLFFPPAGKNDENCSKKISF